MTLTDDLIDFIHLDPIYSRRFEAWVGDLGDHREDAVDLIPRWLSETGERPDVVLAYLKDREPLVVSLVA